MGARIPSVDSISRIYALMDSQPVRQILCDIAHRFKRNEDGTGGHPGRRVDAGPIQPGSTRIGSRSWAYSRDPVGHDERLAVGAGQELVGLGVADE